MEILRPAEAQLLAATRTLLLNLSQRAGAYSRDQNTMDAFSLGRLAETFDNAETAIFNAMNVAQAHCNDEAAKAFIGYRQVSPELFLTPFGPAVEPEVVADEH